MTSSSSAVPTLIELVRNNDVEGVRGYIATGKDLNVTDKLHRSGLHMASWAGNVDILQMLIRAKADITLKAMDAFTLLHFAATSSSPNAAQCIELIGKKARAIIHQRSSKGLKSALHLAIPKGRVDVIQALLEIGLDPLAKTSNGQTAVDLAKQVKNPEVYNIVRSFAENRGKQFTGRGQSPDDEEDDEDEDDEDEDEDEDGEDNDSKGNTSDGEEEEGNGAAGAPEESDNSEEVSPDQGDQLSSVLGKRPLEHAEEAPPAKK